MKFRCLSSWLLGLTMVFICSACGGSSNKDTKYGYVRLINAVNLSSVPNLILSADASNSDDPDHTISAVAAGQASSYDQFKAESYSVVVSSADGSLTASSTQTLTVSDDGNSDKDYHYSVVAYQRGGLIKLVSIQEDETAPNSGFAKLTAVNAGSDAGAVDVFVVPPGTTSLSNRSAVFSQLSTGSTSQTQSTSIGTYDIVVTAKDTPSDVRLTLSSVTLTDKEIVTIVLTPTPGGGLLDGTLVQHGGSISMQPNTNARVRVAAAYDVNTNVTMTDTATTKTFSVASPNVGSYKLIPANDAVTLTVGSSTVATFIANTFSKGNDYTILAYGTTAAPEATILEDNNQLPSSGARIRLINAAVSGGGISLKVNSTSLFQDIGYGLASDYSGISSGSTTLKLSSAVTGYHLLDSDYTTPQTVSSGSVYSLFVLGTTTNATAKLVSDR